ncbi:MAG: amino acid--tRNA ligase-related protein, partial [Saprospiraceae bacterium]|nr:amino acid--tRNA ligase-related protein [Saprospiraceae bacterium]
MEERTSVVRLSGTSQCEAIHSPGYRVCDNFDAGSFRGRYAVNRNEGIPASGISLTFAHFRKRTIRMYRTHNCGELRITDIGKEITLSGWVQIAREFGGLTFVDLRDRYGITQLVFDMEEDAGLCQRARKLGREFVIRVTGVVRERSNKNPNRPTGDIEILASGFDVLNASEVPPFTIEDDTDGGDDLRMKYRYLDIRRDPVKEKIIFRSKVAIETRKHLSGEGFVEVETPCLIKSTPEGARDFVVPSRMNPGQFYALPQSPQTFKQILMVGGLDKYFQ